MRPGYDDGRKADYPTQLQRLNKEKGEALILLGRQYPYITHLADISEYHLPVLPRRPFPEIAENDAPVRRVLDVPDLDEPDHEDNLSMLDWDDIPPLEELLGGNEPPPEKKTVKEGDFQKQLGKRIEELRGKRRKRRK